MLLRSLLRRLLKSDRPELVDKVFDAFAELVARRVDLDGLKQARRLHLLHDKGRIEHLGLLLLVWFDALDEVRLGVEKLGDQHAELSCELVVEGVDLDLSSRALTRAVVGVSSRLLLYAHDVHELDSLHYRVTCMVHVLLLEAFHVVSDLASVMDNRELATSTELALLVVRIGLQSIIKLGEKCLIILPLHD